jgi:hypothetical protein
MVEDKHLSPSDRHYESSDFAEIKPVVTPDLVAAVGLGFTTRNFRVTTSEFIRFEIRVRVGN